MKKPIDPNSAEGRKIAKKTKVRAPRKAMDRTEEVMRRLLQVPKDEVDAKKS